MKTNHKRRKHNRKTCRKNEGRGNSCISSAKKERDAEMNLHIVLAQMKYAQEQRDKNDKIREAANEKTRRSAIKAQERLDKERKERENKEAKAEEAKAEEAKAEEAKAEEAKAEEVTTKREERLMNLKIRSYTPRIIRNTINRTPK